MLRTDNQRGFTLLEMLAVIAIMTVMALIAVPAFMKLLPGMRLNSSARQVYMAFSRARQAAVSQKADTSVELDQASNTIVVWGKDGSKDAPDIFEGTLDDGVSIADVPSNAFTYNSRGLPEASFWQTLFSLAYTIRLENTEGTFKSIKIYPSGSIKIIN